MKGIVLLLLVFLFPMQFWGQKIDGIKWLTFEQLDSALVKNPKKTLIFFEADWCVYCKKIERRVFTSPQIIKEINADYYAVRMNVESKDEIHFDGLTFVNEQSKTQRNGVHQLPLMLASRNNAPFSLPATLILDEHFKIKSRVFEYYTSKELMLLL